MKGFREIHLKLRREISSWTKKYGRPENDQEMSRQGTKAGILAVVSFIGSSKPRVIAVAVIGGLLIAGSAFLAEQHYVNANTVSFYRVYVSGEEIGTIDDKSQLQALFEAKEQDYKQRYPDANMAVHTEKITTKPEQAHKVGIDVDADKTLNKLYGMLTGYAKGAVIRVNGKVVATVKDEASAEAVLEQVKGKYVPKTSKDLASKIKLTGGVKTSEKKSEGSGVILESAKFNEEISVAAVNTDPNKVLSTEQAVKRIIQGDKEAITYEVLEGDTISSIARRFDVSQKELFSHNPGVKELTLQIGTKLNVSAMQPSITVKTVEKVSEDILTEPQVIIRKNPSMRAEESKVIAQGTSGMKTMEYRLTKENGQVVAEEWLGQIVKKSSLPKIVMRGTKVVLGEGSGQFAWPVTGATMTSSYGERWGEMHKGVDLVSSNRSILAADDGVISFAGTKSGYGNCIIIDHRNGYETLYGHLSKINVSEGEVVEKGSTIGIMGSTGDSTGTHLHFEIHKNGSLQNPMTYL